MKIGAFAYLRVSGQGQIIGHGFKRQLETVQAYASKHGYEIEAVFKEKGVSGATEETDRPAFSEMVEAMLSNSVRTVIVESLDRLAREFRIQEQLLIYLASKEISLINASTGENVTEAISSDPMRKALVQIQGIFAELDKSLLVRKLSKAREEKRRTEGKCEGRKKFGEDDPEEEAVIKKIHYLKRRKNGQKKSYGEIASILNEEGLRTKTGKPWTKTQVWRIANHQ